MGGPLLPRALGTLRDSAATAWYPSRLTPGRAAGRVVLSLERIDVDSHASTCWLPSVSVERRSASRPRDDSHVRGHASSRNRRLRGADAPAVGSDGRERGSRLSSRDLGRAVGLCRRADLSRHNELEPRADPEVGGRLRGLERWSRHLGRRSLWLRRRSARRLSVSYTHLTLPTIYSV